MSDAFEVPSFLDGDRLDRALCLLTGRSRADVASAIAAGEVYVGSRLAKSRHERVTAGARLTIAAEVRGEAQRLAAASNSVPFRVVYEDDAIVVIDKPAGVVVHPGAGHRDDTLVSGLLGRYPELAALREKDGPDRPGIVHRLDKDTSGLLVVARSAQAVEDLRAQLRDHSMTRTYVALAVNHLEADAGRIEAPIGRSDRSPTRMTVSARGRDAATNYRVTRRFDLPVPTTLLEADLETGRTHQIRVHLRAIGHPVVGDGRYGGRLGAIDLARPFLHASRLTLRHPVTGTVERYEAPLAPELVAALATLS